MNRVIKTLRFAIVSWVFYIAISVAFDLFLNQEFELGGQLITGLVFATFLAVISVYFNPVKDGMAFVPVAEIKDGVDWKNIDVIRDFLEKHPHFENATIKQTEQGLHLEFSKMWGLRKHKVEIRPSDDGIHMESTPYENYLGMKNDDHYLSLMTARWLFAKAAD